MRKIFRWMAIGSVLLLSGISGFFYSWYRHSAEPSVTDVRVIQTYHSPAIFVQQLAGDPQAGRKIFQEFCTACHAPQPVIDIQAPRVGDKKAWRGLQKVPLEVLLKITTKGVGAMPARGGCFECSDEQLRETIRYMRSRSR